MGNATPRSLYSPWRADTHCTGGWVGPRARMDRCGNCRPPPGFDPRTVQPVSSRYTDWAIPAHFGLCMTHGNWLQFKKFYLHYLYAKWFVDGTTNLTRTDKITLLPIKMCAFSLTASRDGCQMSKTSELRITQSRPAKLSLYCIWANNKMLHQLLFTTYVFLRLENLPVTETQVTKIYFTFTGMLRLIHPL